MKTIHGVALGRLRETLDDLPYEQRVRAGIKAGPGAMSDYTIKVWPSRSALDKTLDMQAKRARRPTDWKPAIKACGRCLQPETEHHEWCGR